MGKFYNYRITISIFVFFASVMIIVQYLYIYPGFRGELIANIENDAVKTGNFLKNTIVKIYPGNRIAVKNEYKHLLGMIINDLGIMTLKLYSSGGEILYSTNSEEIGKINKKKYFRQVVASGKNYSEIVHKHTRTREDNISESDVLETYVPIIYNSRFIGAFEIYYDITREKRNLDKLIKNSSSIVCILVLLLIVSASFIYISSKRFNRERMHYEDELRLLANTDSLTGVSNRRHFMKILETEFQRSKRYRQNFSIILIDLDNFKVINDSYGHLAGDDVLRLVSLTFSSHLRKTDICGRYGGEEFIFLLPSADMDAGSHVAEKLRSAVESHKIPIDKVFMDITISAGVSVYDGTGDENTDSIIFRADKALYEAKRSGKNRVRRSDGLIS